MTGINESLLARSGSLQFALQIQGVGPLTVAHGGYTGGGSSIDTDKLLAKESGTPALLS